MRKKILILPLLCLSLGALQTGCQTVRNEGEAVQEEAVGERAFFNSSSSYFDRYSSKTTDKGRVSEGTVHQENDGNAVLAQVTASEDTVITVTGTLDREEGDIRLVYAAPDGAETLIAGNDVDIVDVELPVKKGTGVIRFDGNQAVCNFELLLGAADGVTYLEHAGE